MNDTPDPRLRGNKQKLLTKQKAISLALELGYIIALPIIALGLLGKWADGRWGTEPWLTLAGILLAIITTTIWLSRRFRDILQAMKTPDKPQDPQP